MKEEIMQLWICPKCKGKDRTIYREDPNRRKCLSCGTELNLDKVIKTFHDGVRLI